MRIYTEFAIFREYNLELKNTLKLKQIKKYAKKEE